MLDGGAFLRPGAGVDRLPGRNNLCARTDTDTCAHTHADTCARTDTDTCARTDTDTCARTDTDAHAHAHGNTHAVPDTRAHADTFARAHGCAVVCSAGHEAGCPRLPEVVHRPQCPVGVRRRDGERGPAGA